ncbi:hypothetical protein HN371_09675 [Candidatus Poribacteria bacterium]|jgi:hypothetical protein|nr:hypothetical protein [Candidatus Poribacteria bacterium]MBT5536897.1 hypothetical protein [Candidatus Poribacteria bacterium]MBT5711987.1 hypothetical protein [Candidatus Poribacteria bacterium]MBT7100763.1 hypothetical protein [Candidatus Poribacteria bacterium]MBT7809684.1 hypothetical protein [Candidatus Poribacteria bacterium]
MAVVAVAVVPAVATAPALMFALLGHSYTTSISMVAGATDGAAAHPFALEE